MRKKIKETFRRGVAMLLALSMALPLYSGINTTETKAASAAELKTGTYYEIIAKSTGMALTVSGYSTANDAEIVQMPANEYASQIWSLEDMGEGYFRIVNYHSGKALNMPRASVEAGTRVIQWNKENSNNSKWLMEDVGDGLCRITPYLVPEFGLNIEGNSKSSGAAVIQWEYAGADNSRFEFREIAAADIKNNPEMTMPDPKVAMDQWLAKFYYTEEKNGKTLGRVSNTSGFWVDAEILEVMIDAYEELGDKKYLEVAEQFYAGFIDEWGSDWAWNEYNDDVFWMSLATVRLYLNTGKQEYLNVAEHNFNLGYDRAWDETFMGGGLWWKTDEQSKNACVNGPGALTAYCLGQATGDKTYYEKSKKIVDWMIDNLIKDNGVVIDHFKIDGTYLDGYVSTGNQGNFMGAAAQVYRYTGDVKYLEAAALVANHTITMGDGAEGYLNREWHERDGCGGKGILGRWFNYFIETAGSAIDTSAYTEWIKVNGMAAWFNRNSDDLMYSAFGRLTEDNIENSETLMEADTPLKNFASWSCSAAVSWVLNMEYPETEAVQSWEVKSPDGNTTFNMNLSDAGALTYSVTQDGVTIVEESSLGINTNLGDFRTGLVYKKTNTDSISETYSVISGKKSKYTNRANITEAVFTKNGSNTEFSVIIRAYNDGIAFRYAVKDNGGTTLTIAPNNENTTIKLPEQSQMWYMEYANDFMYERDYVTGTIGSIATGTISSMPMLFKTGEKYALVTEAEKTGSYVGSHLQVGAGRVLTTIFDPDQTTNVSTTTPFESPWRAIVIGNEETLVNNTMTENLSDAPDASYKFEEWVEPGVSSWSWVSYEGRQEDPETHKRFIDLAANMGWEYYILDEKWQPTSNTGGSRYEGMYGWFNEVRDYAEEKGVKLIAWVDKSDVDTDAEREARFKEWSEAGIVGIKVDFFYDETQSKLQLHDDIYADAAKYRLLVNVHGSNPPSGEIRTYPNVIAREAIKGQEQGGISSEQYTLIPFIRAAVGTADVTEQLYSRDTGKTSMGFQIALSTLVENGIRSMGGRPEDYYGIPEAVSYYNDFPATWDDTKLINAEVGKYVDIARKSGDNWYAAGISTTAKTATWTANFLADGVKYTAFYYTENGNSRTDLATKVQKNVTNATQLSIPVQAGGGYAIKFIPESETLTDITASVKDVKIQVYNETNITLAMSPSSLSATDVEWTAANSSLVKITPTGVGAIIKGLKAGKTTITVKSLYDSSVTEVINLEVMPETYSLDTNKWSVINDKGGYVVNSENSVTIEGEFGSIDKNVFAMKVPNNEDFEITAKISGDLFANYQGGFIAAFDSTNLNNYVAAGRRYHQYMAVNGNRNLFAMMANNTEFYASDTNSDAVAYVRLVKTGNTFTGYYRFNENDAWTQIINGDKANVTNQGLATSGNLCVGFYASSGGTYNNREITFEDFTYNGTKVNFANYNSAADSTYNYTYYSLEGENGALLNGATNVTEGACSNGAYAGGIGGPNRGMSQFTIYSDMASTRKIKIYHATAQTRTFGVIVNGKTYSVVGGGTGGWGTPATTPLEVSVDLQQGKNIIQITGVDGAYAPNLDKIEIQLTADEATYNTEAIERKIRVTCVGDSITWGVGASNADADYPSQLQSVLGTDEFIVTACGASGAFACESTDLCWFPYITSNEYQQSLVSNPDVVMILIGTNDAAESMCWGKIKQGVDVESAFRTGYENLIKTYLNLESKPRVILGTPLTSINSDNREQNNTNGTIPIIKELAEKYGLTLVDLHEFTKDWTNDNYLSDGLHPNDAGYTVMGEYLAPIIKNEAGILSDITVNGTTIKGFEEDKTEYKYEYENGIPTIGATASIPKVRVSVTQGTADNKVANIRVTTAVGTLLKEYTVNLKDANEMDVISLEAEDAVRSNGANRVEEGSCSGGYYVGSIGGDAGDTTPGTVTFTVNVDVSAKWQLNIYQATLNARDFKVIVNGTEAGVVNCPGTGGWGTPAATPVTMLISLKAGENTIALTGADAYAPNLDKIVLVETGELIEDETTTEQPTDPPVEEPGEVFGQVISSPAEGTINVVWGFDPNIYKGELYNVYVDGELKLSKVVCGAYDITGISGGTHTVKITAVLNDIESNGVTGDVTVAEKAELKAAVELNGFQISTTVEGYRTLYSVSDPNGEVTSVGLVYGLADYASESDMVINSANDKVFDYVATEAGKMSETVSELESATSYTMTMRYGTVNTDFLSADVSVRAYAVLKDGTVIYSDVQTTSVFDIAAVVYGKLLMNTEEAHNYLYTNILTVVDPSYKAVDFNWNNTIVGA